MGSNRIENYLNYILFLCHCLCFDFEAIWLAAHLHLLTSTISSLLKVFPLRTNRVDQLSTWLFSLVNSSQKYVSCFMALSFKLDTLQNSNCGLCYESYHGNHGNHIRMNRWQGSLLMIWLQTFNIHILAQFSPL